MDKSQVVFGVIQMARDIGVFAVAGYYIQLLLTKSADRKFESYKTELNHKTREFQSTLDSKIELYRADLGLQNYKSTQVYERQLNVFINLFEKISELNIEMIARTSVVKMVSTDVVEAEKEENAAWAKICELHDDLFKYYKKNLIFIPKSTDVKIKGLLDEYFNNINNCIVEKHFGTKTDFAIMTAKAGKIGREKIQPVLDQLIVDFQSLIGVKDQRLKNDE